ncbi:hypothetical protein TNCV_2131461 [Trichonephila clavipes]|nr:hypothetical protein TNCV_2131461 [Trichonephila clavipes]
MITILYLTDVTIQTEIIQAAEKVEEVAGFVGLNLLFNNAGIARKRMLMDLSPYFMEEHFKTNAVGPVMLVKCLISKLFKKSVKSTEIQVVPLITCVVASYRKKGAHKKQMIPQYSYTSWLLSERDDK